MKVNKLWECIKVNHSKFIIFMKYGNFYKVYGDDAYIIWKITGYKLIDDSHIGFPLKSISDVLKKLELLRISYIVYDRENDYMMVEVLDDEYDNFLKTSKTEFLYEKRIKDIVSNFEQVVRNDNEALEHYEREL